MRLKDFFAMLASVFSPLDWYEEWELPGGKPWICKDGLSVAPCLSLLSWITGIQSCAALSQSTETSQTWTLNTMVSSAEVPFSEPSTTPSSSSQTRHPFLLPRHVSCAGKHIDRPGGTCASLMTKINSNWITVTHPGFITYKTRSKTQPKCSEKELVLLWFSQNKRPPLFPTRFLALPIKCQAALKQFGSQGGGTKPLHLTQTAHIHSFSLRPSSASGFELGAAPLCLKISRPTIWRHSWLI